MAMLQLMILLYVLQSTVIFFYLRYMFLIK